MVLNHAFVLKGYSIRNGCCWNSCCCIDDNNYIDQACCCDLYSFSLQGSNDNKTWSVIHKVSKDGSFYHCKEKTYEFPETSEYKVVRIVDDDESPGCEYCMAINQVEFYGRLVNSGTIDTINEEDDRESVSIIGRINKNDN